MEMDDCAVVFFMSMLVAIFAVACLLLHQILEERRMRKMLLDGGAAVKTLCHGNSFNFYELLRIYHQSSQIRSVDSRGSLYIATLGRKGRIRLTLRMIGDHYVLEKVEHYSDINWQFTGWFDEYVRRDDKSLSHYIVADGNNGGRIIGKRRLPSFELTDDAVKKLIVLLSRK